MSGAHRFFNADDEIKAIDASRDCLALVLHQLFHRQMICADPGGSCSRIEDTIRFITRNLDQEEQLMAAAGYPALAAHKAEHEKLLRKLEKMKRTLVCGNYDNADVFDFVMDWTKRHAAAFDKPFGEFLRKYGTAPFDGNIFRYVVAERTEAPDKKVRNAGTEP